MTASFTESIVEDAVLAWLEALGYAVLHLPAPQSNAARQAGGPEIAPVGSTTDRVSGAAV
jgi:hypothetical protein